MNRPNQDTAAAGSGGSGNRPQMPVRRVALLGPANSIHLRRWADGLARRGWRIDVITQHPEPTWQPAPGVQVHGLPWQGGLGYRLNAAALARLLDRLRPELLNVHYASGYGGLARWARAGLRCPTLLSVWGSDVQAFPLRSPLHRAFLRANLRAAHALAATSRDLAATVHGLDESLAEPFLTPFGVDTELFQPRPRPRGEELVIGTVKGLAPTYGIDILLRGFALLRQEAMRWPQAMGHRLRLVIVGGGPQAGELQRLAQDLGIAAQTHFVGAVAHAEVPGWLAQLDIYVAPSRAESFGVAVLEASSCGRPVVVSQVGGLPEVVEAGRTGLLVPPGQPQALADALAELASNPDRREHMGQAGRTMVLRRFSQDHCLNLMMACMEQVMSRRMAPHA